MKLEELVPPLELCKLIPKGEFEDSCFAWACSCDKRVIEPFVDCRKYIEFCHRNVANAPAVYPAPTLEEIMAKLPPLQEVFRDEFDHGVNLWTTDWGNYSKNATETALRSWFYQKGIDV